MTSTKTSCSVCDEALRPEDQAFCGECARPYHLNQRQDRPGKDCGQVWINEDHLALEFGCNNCLFPEDVAQNLDDVLDAGEAAEVAGMGEDQVMAAADTGSLRHRKTAGGVYLFERRDVLDFSSRK